MPRRSSRTFLLITIVLICLTGYAVYRSRQRAVLEVNTLKVELAEIRSGVVTNGRVEPYSFREIRAEVDGEVAELAVREGDAVRAGQRLMALGQAQLRSELEAVRAELADAEEELRVLRQGGTTRQVNELRTQRETARRETGQLAALVEVNRRLAGSGAIARRELEDSERRLEKTEADLSLLEQRWENRSDPEELARAEARVAAVRSALGLAEARLQATTITAPMDGVLYSLPVRVGDFLRRGAVLARVGDTARTRVRVFVDEPDLGRVSAGQRVLLSWDGLPGSQWQGTVERLASEVVEMDTRRVGEVECMVDNSAGELLPNTNLNVEIITASSEQVISLPREALAGAEGNRHVFVVRDGVLERRAVHTGILNPTRAEITGGLQENEVVALPGARLLEDGLRVRATGE